MGFLRNAFLVGPGGLSGAAGVTAHSKKERTAKEARKQKRLMKASPVRPLSGKAQWSSPEVVGLWTTP